MNRSPEKYMTMNYWDMPSLKVDLVDIFGVKLAKPSNSVANQTEIHKVNIADQSTQTVKLVKTRRKRDAKAA